MVDDEPDVEVSFRQQFRRDLRDGRFTMEFANLLPLHLIALPMRGRSSLILILSDINMPGMSGLELLPKAKAARPDVPIIMITAYGDAEAKRKALEGGAEALLTKPIDFGIFVMRSTSEWIVLLDPSNPGAAPRRSGHSHWCQSETLRKRSDAIRSSEATRVHYLAR